MFTLRGSLDPVSSKPRDGSPAEDAAMKEAFARRQERSALMIAAGVLLGGALLWLGDWSDSVLLRLLGGVVLVLLTLIGAVGRGTCPACGQGFSIPQDENSTESGSWNHCFNCGVRLR